MTRKDEELFLKQAEGSYYYELYVLALEVCSKAFLKKGKLPKSQ